MSRPFKFLDLVLVISAFAMVACGGGGGASGGGVDTTPPTVASTTPTNNATGVGASSALAATFSETMDSATINSTTFSVKDGVSQAVAGAVTYNSGTNTATFTPSSALSNSATYTATVSTGAKDAAGNAIANNYSWNFTISASGAPPTPVTVNTNISASTTWTNDNLYVIANSITVSAPLTIQPGTIVKFKPGTGMDVSGTGALAANGTQLSPIIFTSYSDDTNGGDTNGDGNISSPAVGNWRSIALTGIGATASFDYCRFYYGGSGDGTTRSSKGTVDLRSYSATITNSTFAHNDGGAPALIHGVIDAGLAGTGTVISGNVFYGNNLPLHVNGTFSLDDSNVFHNPADSTQGNAYNGIFADDGIFTVTGNVTWAETEVPFVMSSNQPLIDTGATLTLGIHVHVKFMSNPIGDLITKGTLVANATTGSKIVFTSFKDDSHGGDTNGDGALTAPARDDWGVITLSSSGSVFNNCEFLYSGSHTSSSAIRFSGINGTHSATITNSTFAYNDGGSPAPINGVVDASLAGAGTVITGNVFYGNNLPLYISENFSLDDSNVFHNPADSTQGNTYNGVFARDGIFTVTGNVTWAETEVPFVMAANQPLIDTNASLTLGNNVTVKFMPNPIGILTVKGALNYAAGNAFTSFKDDARGGDTNGDGATTSPAQGDWGGIELLTGTTYSYANWTNIFYSTH